MLAKLRAAYRAAGKRPPEQNALIRGLVDAWSLPRAVDAIWQVLVTLTAWAWWREGMSGAVEQALALIGTAALVRVAWCLWRAPYRQRDEAIAAGATAASAAESQLKVVTAERDESRRSVRDIVDANSKALAALAVTNARARDAATYQAEIARLDSWLKAVDRVFEDQPDAKSLALQDAWAASANRVAGEVVWWRDNHSMPPEIRVLFDHPTGTHERQMPQGYRQHYSDAFFALVVTELVLRCVRDAYVALGKDAR